MKARAQALVPKLRERAAACEAQGEMPDQTFEELQSAGLFKLSQPAKFGGYELGFDVGIEMVMELARGCGSSAWVYGILQDHQSLAAMYPAEAQDEVWSAAPQALVASSFMPAGKATPQSGGYRLSGRWSFSSGSRFASWIILGCMLPPSEPGAAPLMSMMLVPKRDFRIEPNWNVIGLRGTGSNDIVVDDAFVPSHRILSVADANEGRNPGRHCHAGAVFARPFAATSTFTLCAPAVGIAAGAVERFVEEMSARESRGSRLAELATVQLRVAESSAEVDAGRLLIERCVREAQQTLERGEPLTLDERARNRRDGPFAVGLMISAVDRLHRGAGGQALHAAHPLARAFRDVHAVGAHLYTSWDIAGTTYGRVALGLPPGSPIV
ncbi:MAG: acyl-CoA dehydrogenase family protein [Burkholderiaceae bacterium]